SRIHNSMHWAAASKLNYTGQSFFGKKDTSGLSNWSIKNDLSYEFVQSRFKNIAPFREVEFYRDWNINALVPRPDEHLTNVGTIIAHKALGQLGYRYSNFVRGEIYSGHKHVVDFKRTSKRLDFNAVFNSLSMRDTLVKATFHRPKVSAEYRLPIIKHTAIGGAYQLEQNDVKRLLGDTLSNGAFYFDILSAYVKNGSESKDQWMFNYFTRRDKLFLNNQWKDNSRSHNYELTYKVGAWKTHRLAVSATMRSLKFVDSNTEDQSLLARLDYGGQLFNRLLSFSTLYDVGAGQEQKRIYS